MIRYFSMFHDKINIEFLIIILAPLYFKTNIYTAKEMSIKFNKNNVNKCWSFKWPEVHPIYSTNQALDFHPLPPRPQHH